MGKFGAGLLLSAPRRGLDRVKIKKSVDGDFHGLLWLHGYNEKTRTRRVIQVLNLEARHLTLRTRLTVAALLVVGLELLEWSYTDGVGLDTDLIS